MVLMAIVTTAMTGPILAFYKKRNLMPSAS
jgi:hypothetical protein